MGFKSIRAKIFILLMHFNTKYLFDILSSMQDILGN